MRPISKKLKFEIQGDPYYDKCARAKEGGCDGRITWEHAFIYAGKQINEKWAIIPLCRYHHLGDGLDKRKNQLIALQRATPEDLAKYPKTDWEQLKKSLLSQVEVPPEPPMDKQRTVLQNRALHLYFKLVADTLNDAGLDMRAVLKPEVEIPWTKDTVKDFMWKPIQKIMLDKKSTTELSTKDIDIIYDTMNRHLAKHGVTEAFPSIEEIISRQSGLSTKKPLR